MLDSLTPECRAQLTVNARVVDLPLRMELYVEEETPEFAYFPTSGITSIVNLLSEGGGVEVGLTGCEGVVGLIHILGTAPIQTRGFMQMAGSGIRVPLKDLRNVFEQSSEGRSRLLEFAQLELLTLSQIAVCYRLHEAETRLARWLLMVQDRVNLDTFLLTQEFIAQMLGSRRTTVALAAGALQQRGLIEYRRGQVRILNREHLEHAACECYSITKRLLVNLYR